MTQLESDIVWPSKAWIPKQLCYFRWLKASAAKTWDLKHMLLIWVDSTDLAWHTLRLDSMISWIGYLFQSFLKQNMILASSYVLVCSQKVYDSGRLIDSSPFSILAYSWTDRTKVITFSSLRTNAQKMTPTQIYFPSQLSFFQTLWLRVMVAQLLVTGTPRLGFSHQSPMSGSMFHSPVPSLAQPPPSCVLTIWPLF